jgi:hypothetical protein
LSVFVGQVKALRPAEALAIVEAQVAPSDLAAFLHGLATKKTTPPSAPFPAASGPAPFDMSTVSCVWVLVLWGVAMLLFRSSKASWGETALSSLAASASASALLPSAIGCQKKELRKLREELNAKKLARTSAAVAAVEAVEASGEAVGEAVAAGVAAAAAVKADVAPGGVSEALPPSGALAVVPGEADEAAAAGSALVLVQTQAQAQDEGGKIAPLH